MGSSKIQDEAEILRWFDEGRTYQWMQQEYLRKYNITTGLSMWSNFRRRRGLDRRIVRNDDLIPWEVREQHRWRHAIRMLRAVARKRQGKVLDVATAEALEPWLRGLASRDAVVHYDPDTDDGFHYVARRPGVDLDLIREPDRKTTARRNPDRETTTL